MPELPEVECIRRGLLPAVGRRITLATLHRRDVATAPSRIRAPMLLQGAALGGLLRRGKQLALIAQGGAPVVVVQLGMSGQLIRRAPGQRLAQADHVHATWRLDDGSRLAFRDPRRFGGLRLLPDEASLLAAWDADLGPDALTIEPAALGAALAGSARAIKIALLDQGVLAGVGNIYADEALHRAGLHPHRPAGGLERGEVKRLAAAVRAVLGEAIEAGGSTLRDYVDAQGNPGSYAVAHRVYARAGQGCLACGTVLASGTLGQRTTVWCPTCQPTGRIGAGSSRKK